MSPSIFAVFLIVCVGLAVAGEAPPQAQDEGRAKALFSCEQATNCSQCLNPNLYQQKCGWCGDLDNQGTCFSCANSTCAPPPSCNQTWSRIICPKEDHLLGSFPVMILIIVFVSLGIFCCLVVASCAIIYCCCFTAAAVVVTQGSSGHQGYVTSTPINYRYQQLPNQKMDV